MPKTRRLQNPTFLDFYDFGQILKFISVPQVATEYMNLQFEEKKFQIGIHKRTSDLVKFIVLSHRVLSSNSFEFLCNMQTFFDLCMSVYFRIF